MKTYFKSSVGESYLMIDDVEKTITEMTSDSIVKSFSVITKVTVYDRIVVESGDTAKWIISDETTFNNIKDDVISVI